MRSFLETRTEAYLSCFLTSGKKDPFIEIESEWHERERRRRTFSKKCPGTIAGEDFRTYDARRFENWLAVCSLDFSTSGEKQDSYLDGEFAVETEYDGARLTLQY